MKNQINLPSLPLLLSSLLLPINIQTFGALGYLPQLQIMFPCTPLIRMLLLLLKALLLVELLHCLMNLQECSQLMKKKVKGRVTIKKTSIQKLVLLPLPLISLIKNKWAALLLPDLWPLLLSLCFHLLQLLHGRLLLLLHSHRSHLLLPLCRLRHRYLNCSLNLCLMIMHG